MAQVYAHAYRNITRHSMSRSRPPAAPISQALRRLSARTDDSTADELTAPQAVTAPPNRRLGPEHPRGQDPLREPDHLRRRANQTTSNETQASSTETGQERL